QRRREHTPAASPSLLRAEQRGVGRTQQRMRIVSMIRIDARAHAHADAQLTPMNEERALELLEEPRADALDFFDRGDALANDGEFIAAEARAERACGRTLRAQTLAHRLQYAVAERVTQAV